jgi:hypothetical protein
MGDEVQDVAGRPAGRWSAVLSWPLLVLLGWLLFELTAQPGLGAAVLCVKFGWNDFRTAWWLRRRDPWRARGRACFWTCLASGCGRVGFTAFLVVSVCVGLAPTPGRPGRPGGAANGVPAEFLIGLIIGFVGGLLMLLTAGRGLWLAWRHGVRVWVSPAIHQARRWDLWPPSAAGRQPDNMAGCLVIWLRTVTFGPAGNQLDNTAGCLVIWLLVALLMVAFSLLVFGLVFLVPQPGQDAGALCLLGVLLVFLIGGPVVILLLMDYLRGHVLARYPEECWPAAALGHRTEETGLR